jgi:hypothetical protein
VLAWLQIGERMQPGLHRPERFAPVPLILAAGLVPSVSLHAPLKFRFHSEFRVQSSKF